MSESLDLAILNLGDTSLIPVESGKNGLKPAPPKERPAPQPKYILRGHAGQIQTLHFHPSNLFLLSGDSTGFIVYWDIVSRRPIAVWKGHETSILGLTTWETDLVISHGRDGAIKIWHLPPSGFDVLNVALPADGPREEHRRPPCVFSFDCNTMNFCSFAITADTIFNTEKDTFPSHGVPENQDLPPVTFKPAVLVCPGNSDSDSLDVVLLPSNSRLNSISACESPKLGMPMSLAVTCLRTSSTSKSHLFVIAGYESGHLLIYSYDDSPTSTPWSTIYIHKAHSQTLLSLSLASDQSSIFTSSADALLVKHPFLVSDLAKSRSNTTAGSTFRPLKAINTKHAGQQGISIRSDSRVFVTAGWDGRARVYSAKTMKELAVLKWQRTGGVYATAMARVLPVLDGLEVVDSESKTIEFEDGHGGTDALVRTGTENEDERVQDIRRHDLDRLVKDERVNTARSTHWIAVGGKDGKITLWDIL